MGGIMRLRTVILIVVALLVCPMSRAQTKSLGDVAGTIKLNPDAIVEKSGVVEAPGEAKRADENLFGSVLAECSAAADLLCDLVAQARVPSAGRNLELMNRMESAATELEVEVHSITLLRLTDDFAQPIEIARQAETACVEAGASVREAVSRGGAMFGNAEVAAMRCKQLLDQAKAELVAVDQPAARPVTPESDEPPTDDAIIAAWCEPQRAKGIDAFESCLDLQYMSQAAVASRSASNELIDEGVFSDIRELCLKLHPRDFVGRDGCEQDRMTTARLEEQ